MGRGGLVMTEYWQKCLEEFEDSLLMETQQEEINDEQVKLLKKEIEYCKERINND